MSDDTKKVAKEIAKEVAKNSEPKSGLLGKLRVAALIVVGVIVIVLLTKNWKTAPVDVIVFKGDMKVAILILVTFLIGTVFGLLLAFLRPWRKKG